MQVRGVRPFLSDTVKEYCEKWLLMQSANVRTTTLIDYTSKVNRHIIAPLGHMRMAEVTADDIKLALVPVSKKSASVFKSVNILYRCILYCRSHRRGRRELSAGSERPLKPGWKTLWIILTNTAICSSKYINLVETIMQFR